MIAALIAGGLLLFGGGVGVGVAVSRDRTAAAVEAQTELIGEIQDGQRAIVEAAGRPVVIDAEVRASLADVPVQCLREMGGSPLSVHCAWATCLQHGASSANRPECSDLSDALVEALQATPEPTPAAP